MNSKKYSKRRPSASTPSPGAKYWEPKNQKTQTTSAHHVHDHGYGHRHGHGHHHHSDHHHHGGHWIQVQVLQRKSVSRRSSSDKRKQTASISLQTEPQAAERQQVEPAAVSCQMCEKVRQLRLKSADLQQATAATDVIVRTADGQTFYCHSFVIDVWAPSLLANRAPTKREFEIDVLDFPGNVVGACLRLMYSDGVDQIPMEHLEQMMKLADTYQLPDLKEACLLAASTAELTPANACYLWYFASKYPMLVKMQQRTMRFVLANVDAIVNDPDGRDAWDVLTKNSRMLLELFYAISAWTKPKSEKVPERDKQMDDLWNGSNGLRKPYGYPDMTIVTKEGTNFHVHLPLLVLSAPAFAQSLRNLSSKPNGPAHIDNFDGDVVEEFLRGLYHQEPSENFPELVDLVFTLADEYEADSVIDTCERQMAGTRLQSIQGAVELLLEAEEHRMPVAKSMCFRYLYGVAPQLLRNDKDWRKMAEENPALIAEMVARWEAYRQLD